jgi:hypothetical protein
MEHNTMLHLKTKQDVIRSLSIQIQSGIFQGDSLSPLLFCTAITVLTQELNYRTEREISHLLYMDDLKLLGRSEDDSENEIKIVKAIGKDINMNFGLEKCAKICLKKGRVQSKIYNGSTSEKDIKELDPREAHAYLGTEKNHDIQHKNVKEKLKKEYLRRLSLVLGKELSAENTIQAIGSLAVPALR